MGGAGPQVANQSGCFPCERVGLRGGPPSPRSWHAARHERTRRRGGRLVRFFGEATGARAHRCSEARFRSSQEGFSERWAGFQSRLLPQVMQVQGQDHHLPPGGVDAEASRGHLATSPIPLHHVVGLLAVPPPQPIGYAGRPSWIHRERDRNRDSRQSAPGKSFLETDVGECGDLRSRLRIQSLPGEASKPASKTSLQGSSRRGGPSPETSPSPGAPERRGSPKR